MNKARAKGKAKIMREVVEREETDDDEDLPVSVRQQQSGMLDANKTVEEVVFGSGTLLDGAAPPVYTDWKQVAERQRRQKAMTQRRQDLNVSFHPLASSSFLDPGISDPIALDLSSPLDISNISFAFQPSPLPPVSDNPIFAPSQPGVSTYLPAYDPAASSSPLASRTMPGPQCPLCPQATRAASQPLIGIQPAAPPQSSASLPGINTTSNLSAREEKLKQRLEDVENQIARVNVALQSQGIETELSEESQLRLISFLQRRLLDLEAKVAEVGEKSGSSGYSFEQDSLERGRSRQACSRDRSRSRSKREDSEHSILFDLQELVSRKK